MFSVQDEYKTLVDIAGRTAGGSHGSLLGQDDAVYVVVHANKVLAHHELKPWRKKNVVRPDAGR